MTPKSFIALNLIQWRRWRLHWLNTGLYPAVLMLMQKRWGFTVKGFITIRTTQVRKSKFNMSVNYNSIYMVYVHIYILKLYHRYNMFLQKISVIYTCTLVRIYTNTHIPIYTCTLIMFMLKQYVYISNMYVDSWWVEGIVCFNINMIKV